MTVGFGLNRAACSSEEMGRAFVGALVTRRVLLVVPLFPMSAKAVVCEAIRLAYSPLTPAVPGRKRFALSSRYDRSVVTWLVIFAVLNAVT